MGDIFYRGKPGNEEFHGKTGNDTIQGWTGNDKLYGDVGNDALYGQEDDDKLYGEEGDDKLEGGSGNDIMKGGVGADLFVFRDGYGKDVIIDFKATGKIHDTIDLSDLTSIADFDDLKAHHLHQHGQDVVISGGFGNMLTLEHVKINDLDETDFFIF
jgi:Ca2+-binding RTX toxin-like protein